MEQTVMEGISPHPDGWLVRLFYVDDKPKYQKFFKYGTDRNEALEQAKKYRDRIVKRMQLMGDRKRPYTRKKPQRNNTSGYLGITFASEWGVPDERGQRTLYEKYKSFFIDEAGIHRNLSFSINKYGKEEALQLAIMSRKLKRRATLKDLK